MTNLEKGIAIHERLAALMQADSVPMSDAWGELHDALVKIATAPSPALGFVSALEESVLGAELFPGSPDWDLAATHLDANFVIFPRCTFRQVDDLRVEIYRGELLMGLIYNTCDGWFISLPQHRIGDVPPFRSLEQAMGKVRDTLDEPA